MIAYFKSIIYSDLGLLDEGMQEGRELSSIS